MLFSELNLIEPILKALEAEGYTQPTPIQERAIPVVLQGGDLLGCAQTGTGKTAAFAIPTLQLLAQNKMSGNGRRPIRALVLTPTRELAVQIKDSFNAYGANLSLRLTTVYGGVPQRPQTTALRTGVDILIATPGRLLDLMNQGYIDLGNLEVFVLDEADRMLDMGFIHDIKRILKDIPANRQTMFFSATMPRAIQELADSLLTNPVKVEITPVAATTDQIQQALYYVDKSNKKALLLHLLADPGVDSALVFTRTKHGADRITKELNDAGIRAQAIHGNKSQGARQSALNDFKRKRTRVLVATDIAARGIDVDQLSHVFNFELPNEAETYVHRIGRTGRAGANGIAISFCDREEKNYLRDIKRLINKEIPLVTEHPYALPASEFEMRPGGGFGNGGGSKRPYQKRFGGNGGGGYGGNGGGGNNFRRDSNGGANKNEGGGGYGNGNGGAKRTYGKPKERIY